MNLLENYLVEVFKIEPCKDEWINEEWAKDKEWINVTASFNCYGCITKNTDVYLKDDWDGIVKRGYYLG